MSHGRRGPEVPTCDVCGGHDCRVLYPSRLDREVEAADFRITDKAYGTTGTIVVCSNCGLGYAFPRPPRERLETLYAELVDPAYCVEADGRAASCRRVLGRLEARLGGPGTLLDVGAATGILLRVARERGWQVTGVEPSAWAARHAAAQHGLEVVCAPFPTPLLAGRVFDAVSMLDVLEHVDSPRRALEAAHERLRPGGLLCLVTPDAGSLVARLLGRRWWHVRVAHLYYFRRAPLWRLLADTGFRLLERRRYGWTFSLEYLATRLDVSPVPAIVRRLRASAPGRWLLGRRLRVNFGDSFEVYATRA